MQIFVNLVINDLRGILVLGKLLCGFMARGKLNPWVVGAGMLPRGEVGLAFAFVGKSLGIIDASMFSVLVIMVIVTTLGAPGLLRLASRGMEKAG